MINGFLLILDTFWGVNGMLKAYEGDITTFHGVEYICNAANGIGPMGAGVAGAIRKAGGAIIEQEATEVCKRLNPQPGTLYVTSAGSLPFKGVIHLVTMKFPGGFTDYDIVSRCLESLKEFCRTYKVSSVALPALGTGVGRLNPVLVAELFKRHLGAPSSTQFWVVDIDKRFIECFKSPRV